MTFERHQRGATRDFEDKHSLTTFVCIALLLALRRGGVTFGNVVVGVCFCWNAEAAAMLKLDAARKGEEGPLLKAAENSLNGCN